MSTGLPRPGLARSAHRGRIKFLRGYVSISSAAVNRPTHDHAASLSEVARTSMRSAFRGPAHQLAVRMRINNCTPVLVNDTMTGDPLMTVPILTNEDVAPGDPFYSLCYEVHGQAHYVFNFVSDTCVTVNAHYARTLILTSTLT